MLNQSISSPTWTPSRRSDWRRGLSDRQAAIVRRYVLVVVVLSALGCIYLWQINGITDLRQKTLDMRAQTEEIEGANAMLMERLARWEAPSRIDEAATAAGWRRAAAPMYVQVLPATEASLNNIQQIASSQTIR